MASDFWESVDRARYAYPTDERIARMRERAALRKAALRWSLVEAASVLLVGYLAAQHPSAWWLPSGLLGLTIAVGSFYLWWSGVEYIPPTTVERASERRRNREETDRFLAGR